MLTTTVPLTYNNGQVQIVNLRSVTRLFLHATLEFSRSRCSGSGSTLTVLQPPNLTSIDVNAIVISCPSVTSIKLNAAQFLRLATHSLTSPSIYHQKHHQHHPTHSSNMPRNGDGSSDNVVDNSAGSQVHGVGEDSSVDRSNKVRLE